MEVRWSQARARSVEHWRRIHDSIGQRDPLALVFELNELAELCEMAIAVAGGDEERCRHCAVFADVQQCADIRLDISARLLNGETDRARAATMAVIERIAAARMPGHC